MFNPDSQTPGSLHSLIKVPGIKPGGRNWVTGGSRVKSGLNQSKHSHFWAQCCSSATNPFASHPSRRPSLSLLLQAESPRGGFGLHRQIGVSINATPTLRIKTTSGLVTSETLEIWAGVRCWKRSEKRRKAGVLMLVCSLCAKIHAEKSYLQLTLSLTSALSSSKYKALPFSFLLLWYADKKRPVMQQMRSQRLNFWQNYFYFETYKLGNHLVDLALSYFPSARRAECIFCNSRADNASDWLDDSAAATDEWWGGSAGTRICSLCSVTWGALAEFTGVRWTNTAAQCLQRADKTLDGMISGQRQAPFHFLTS